MNPLPVVELRCVVCKCVSLHVEDVNQPTLLKDCARCHSKTLHTVIPFTLTNGRGCDRFKYDEKGESK